MNKIMNQEQIKERMEKAKADLIFTFQKTRELHDLCQQYTIYDIDIIISNYLRPHFNSMYSNITPTKSE